MKRFGKWLDASPAANRTVNRWLTRVILSRNFSQPPVIIGGCPRSGTTLLLSILGSHSHIYAIDYETTAFHPDFRPLRLLNGILYTYRNERVRRADTVNRFCEKTPGNIRHIQEINNFFRGYVRFINIVRDGRDVVTSKLPSDETQYAVSPAVWVWDTRNALEAQGMSNTILIRYEDLVADTETTLRGVCEFLEEPFEDGMLDYHSTTNVTEALAWETRAKPIHKRSTRKWEQDVHRERLREFTGEPQALELLRELGYA